MSNYTVIARKWRPQTFDDVVGQDHVVRTLRNAIRQNRIAQAYLFVGPRGTGKTTLARIFAKALNCEHGPTETPCGQCTACREIAAGSSLDVVEIDGASNNKVEDVHAICENIQFAPFGGKYRICYIDEVHMLSASAFNALLKTLEEPPAHAKFIFATTEPETILPTIVSRCQRFDLRRIPVSLIADRLRTICKAEGMDASEDALQAIARGADGGMRDAQSSLDQLIAFRGNRLEEDDVLGVFGLVAGRSLDLLARAILAGDVPTILGLIDEFDRGGKDLRRLVVDLVRHFRDLLVYLHTKGKSDGLDLTDAQRAALVEEAKAATPDGVLKVVETLIDLDERIRVALSRRTLLEAGLIRASRSATATPLVEILRRVTALQKELAAAGGGEVVNRILAAPVPASAPPKAVSSAPVPVPMPGKPSQTAASVPAASLQPHPPADMSALPVPAPEAPVPAGLTGNPDYNPDNYDDDETSGDTMDSPSAPVPKAPPPPNYVIIERPAVQAVVKAFGAKVIGVS